MTNAQCYVEAGFRSLSAAAVDANASRLIGSDKIKARIAELQAPAIKASQITLQSVLAELQLTVEQARQAKQLSVVNGSLALIAKLTGLLVDKVEVGGPNSFAEATMSGTLRMVASEMGPVFAATLAWTLDHEDAEMPVDEVARFTLAHMTLDQALERSDSLRRALLQAASNGAVLVEPTSKGELTHDTVDHQALAMWRHPKKRPAKR